MVLGPDPNILFWGGIPSSRRGKPRPSRDKSSDDFRPKPALVFGYKRLEWRRTTIDYHDFVTPKEKFDR